MKTFNLLSITVIFLLASCNPNEENLQTSVSGKVLNPKEEVVSFRLQDTTVTVNMNKEGMFEADLPLDKANTLVFAHGEEISTLYLRPGDQLSLTIDTEEFDETLQYKGIGAPINNFLASIVLLEDSLPSIMELASFPEDSFVMKLQNNFALKEEILHNSSVEDQEFMNWYLKNNEWEFYYNLLSYPNYRSYVMKEQFEPSEEFYAYQDSIKLYDSSNLEYNYFVPYLQSEITKKVGEKFKDKGPQDASEYVMASVEEVNSIPNDLIKEKLLFEAINTHLNRLNEEDRESILAEWKSLDPSKQKIAVVEDKLKVLASLAEGNPAPDFKYVSLEGDSMTMEDFKGKVVYIDVWATWCGPCISEHPYMEELQQQFEDDSVAFLAISIDSSPEPWKKMVKEKELGGIHLYAEGAWEASIMQNYAINGIPRFILIDQEGKIVNANAARPSGNIAEDIKLLLNQSKTI
ncbi:TlpA family protein disulfide reductase [Marivirga sp.]|uniref:TlpA family protein disulfide reductase n=1 Tax=Marivirga sp. TaxID=2018662 RepID=UPI003DA702B9